ncbi:MAG: hypothetical protein GDA48_20625 [Hormoscilla sp. GM102CHS1]|nr:hypothetical protein [Hormoscilla sp. GM102CHS1]
MSGFQQQGMGAIAPAQVLESLELLMGSASVEVAVVPLDWSAWQDRVAKWPFLAEWKQTATATETGKIGFIQQLKEVIKSERREMLVGHVRSQVAEVLGFSSALDVDLTKVFFDLGIDSLTAVVSCGQL